MNYGFGDGQVQETKGFPLSEKVPNVSLESCEYVKGKQKDHTPYEAIDFTFATPDGGRLRDRMFEVNEDKIEPRGELTRKETIKAAYVEFNTRLWHIADAFEIDRDELKNVCTGHDNFKSFATAFCKFLNEETTGKTVWVKTIRNKGGYINLPRFPKFMQSSSQEPTLEWSKWEVENNAKNKKPDTSVEASDSPEEVEVPADYMDSDEDWTDQL